MKETDIKREAAEALHRAGFNKNKITIALKVDPRTVTRWINNLGPLVTSIDLVPPPVMSTPVPIPNTCTGQSNAPLGQTLPQSIGPGQGGVTENAHSIAQSATVQAAHVSMVERLRGEVDRLIGRLRRAPHPGDRASPADIVHKLTQSAERLIQLERRLHGMDYGPGGDDHRLVVLAVAKVSGQDWSRLADGYASGRLIEVDEENKT